MIYVEFLTCGIVMIVVIDTIAVVAGLKDDVSSWLETVSVPL